MEPPLCNLTDTHEGCISPFDTQQRVKETQENVAAGSHGVILQIYLEQGMAGYREQGVLNKHGTSF